MRFFTAAILSISLATTHLAQAESAARTHHLLTVQAHELRGRNVALILAATCSAENWAVFQKLARRWGLASWENQEKLELKVTKDTLRADAIDFQFRYLHEAATSLRFEARWRGQTVRAKDGCELISRLSEAKSVGLNSSRVWKRIAAASVGRAFGQISEGPRAVEDTTADKFAIASSVVGLGLLAALGWPAMAVAGTGWLAYVTFAGLAFELYSNTSELVRAKKSLNLKDTFGNILNKDLSLECSAGLTVIHSGQQKIVIRKGWNYSIDVFHKESGSALYTDRDFESLPKSREFITNVARKCDTPEQAKMLTAQFSKEISEAEEKVQSLASSTAPTSAPVSEKPTGTAN